MPRWSGRGPTSIDRSTTLRGARKQPHRARYPRKKSRTRRTKSAAGHLRLSRSSATTPRRATTTTPLQALALFNNSFVLDQSSKFASRLRQEVGEDVDRQIERAYELALSRSALDRERELVKPFIARHGLEAFCRVLFNTGAFVQVE